MLLTVAKVLCQLLSLFLGKWLAIVAFLNNFEVHELGGMFKEKHKKS